MKHVILVGANEKTAAGERAYAIALAKSLEQEQDGNFLFHVFKNTAKATDADIEENTRLCQHNILPVTLDHYERVPFATNLETAHMLAALRAGDEAVLLGAGNSTLPLLARLQQEVSAKLGDQNVKASWMSHKINSEKELHTLAGAKITALLPAWIDREMLQTVYPEASAVIDGLDLRAMQGVPTGNTAESLQKDYERFMLYNPAGQALKKYAGNYVAVIPNAGFTAQNGTDRAVPSLQEYYQQGRDIGICVDVENHAIVIIDGGPRAIADEKYYHQQFGEESETPVQAIIRGIYDANTGIKGLANLVIIHDRFGIPTPSGERTNGVNAMVHASKHDPRCVAVITNDEGEGTKYDMMTHGNSAKIMFQPSSACDQDPQRVASRDYYQSLGLSRMTLVTLLQTLTNTTPDGTGNKAAIPEYKRPENVMLSGFDLLQRDFAVTEPTREGVNGGFYKITSYYSASGEMRKIATVIYDQNKQEISTLIVPADLSPLEIGLTPEEVTRKRGNQPRNNG